MKQINNDENYDIETARLYSYFSDGYNYGLKRFKEIANDNPECFDIDSLNNINAVINDMLKPSEDHNDEDLTYNKDEIEYDKKPITKDELLKQEKEIFELSKDGIISEFNLDYVVGFRDGYDYGKSYVNSILKDIAIYQSSFRIINAVQKQLKKIEALEKKSFKIDNINKKINIENSGNELVDEYKNVLEIYELNKPELELYKKDCFELIERMKELGITDKFINTIYKIGNDVNNFDISIDGAIKIINNYKTTVDDVELSIKELKSMYGDYIDLGRGEEEKISNEIINQVYEQTDKRKEYVVDELLKIYKSRANKNKILSLNKYQGKDQENKSEIATESDIDGIKDGEDITFLKEEQEIIDDLHDIEKQLKSNSWNKSIKATDMYLLEKAKSLIERLYNLKTKDEDTLISKIKNESIDDEEVEKLDIIYDTDEFAEVFESPLQKKMGDVMDYFLAINFLSKMILNFDRGLLLSNGEIAKDSTYELLDKLVLSWGLALYELNYEFMKFANLINTGRAEFKITLD